MDPFAAYVTPGECAQSAVRMERQYWSKHRPDTVTYGLFHGPVRRETVEAVRRCVARFALATTAPRDLLGLGQAYLAAERVSQADSAFQRWLAVLARRSAAERRWALVQIVDVYLKARPSQLARGRAYLAQLDRLGPSAATERLMARMSVIAQTIHMDSVALQTTEVAAALGASRQLSPDSARRLVGYTEAVLIWRADLLGRRGDGVGAIAALEQGEREARAICPSAVIMGAGDRYRLRGQAAPTLQVTRWYPDTTGGSHPVSGKRSLLLFTGMENESGTFPEFAVLRRLKRIYPDLDVVLATQTHGAYRAQVLAPTDELERQRWYFLDDQALPAALAIWQTAFRRRAVDRGLTAAPNPNGEAYHGAGHAILIDRRGVIRMTGDLNPDAEIRWRNVIGELH